MPREKFVAKILASNSGNLSACSGSSDGLTDRKFYARHHLLTAETETETETERKLVSCRFPYIKLSLAARKRRKFYAVDENVGGCLAEGTVKESEEGSQPLFLGEQNRESVGECGREGVGRSQRDRGRGAEEREQVSPSGEGGLIKFWIEVPSRATLSLAASYFRPA